MKAGVLAIAAAIASGVSAGNHHAARRHAHEAFHMERGLMMTAPAPNATCGCTTIYTTITGEATCMLNNSMPRLMDVYIEPR